MFGETDRALEALNTAIQMELDGKLFYEEASRKSGNELGRKLLHDLSLEEDHHRRRFEAIYLAGGGTKSWEDAAMPYDGAAGLKTIFAEATAGLGAGTAALEGELDAVTTAMSMENRSFDFYQDRAGKAKSEAEKRFYELVSAEERVHHTLLLDYYEFLKDPAAWFTQKEHPSLD
jgi:rubrerythrin